MLFRDPLFTAGYCDATLTAQAEKASSALLNNCAWLMAKSGMAGVRDVPRALSLSRRAVALAQDKEGPEGVSAEALAAYLHTYAYALAEGGDPEEAKAIMERIAAEKLSNSPLYSSERRRFAALAEDQQSAPREAFPAPGMVEPNDAAASTASDTERDEGPGDAGEDTSTAEVEGADASNLDAAD